MSVESLFMKYIHETTCALIAGGHYRAHLDASIRRRENEKGCALQLDDFLNCDKEATYLLVADALHINENVVSAVTAYIEAAQQEEDSDA